MTLHISRSQGFVLIRVCGFIHEFGDLTVRVVRDMKSPPHQVPVVLLLRARAVRLWNDIMSVMWSQHDARLCI